jgi:hypothetical protein
MGELKSAWEIAQEKANKLGKLSPEEERRQREEKCRQIGQAVAQRWLDASPGQDLAAGVGSYPEEEKGLIKQATLGYLIEAIDFQSSEAGMGRLERAVQGITSLEPKSQPVVERLIELAQEYSQAKEKTRQEVEDRSRGVLHQLRISGTAVGDINVEATPQWQQSEQRLTKAFQPRLDGLKKELSCFFGFM